MLKGVQTVMQKKIFYKHFLSIFKGADYKKIVKKFLKTVEAQKTRELEH